MSPIGIGPELYEWMALRRAHDGGVIAQGGQYTHYGRPILGYVAAALTRLLESGHLVLRPADRDGRQAVCVTVAGQIRFAELQDGRRG